MTLTPLRWTAILALCVLAAGSSASRPTAGRPNTPSASPLAPHGFDDIWQGLDDALERAVGAPPESRAAALLDAAFYVAEGGGDSEAAWIVDRIADLASDARNAWSALEVRARFARSFVHRRLGDRRTSSVALDRALELYERHDLDDPVLFGRMLQQRGNWLRGAPGETEAALEAYLEALRFRRVELPPGHPDLTESLLWTGYRLFRMGRTSDALAMLADAERTLLDAGRRDAIGLGVIAGIRSEAAFLTGDLAAARAEALRTLAVEAKHRFGFGVSRHRIPFARYQLSAIELADGSETEAWEHAVRASRSGTTALVALSRWREIEPDAYADYTLALDALDRARHSDPGAGAPAEAVLAAIEARLRALRTVYGLEREFLSRHPPRYPSLEELRASLPANVALTGRLVTRIGAERGLDRPHRIENNLWLLTREHGLRWSGLGDFTVRGVEPLMRRAIEWPVRVEDDPQLRSRLDGLWDSFLGQWEDSLASVDTLWIESNSNFDPLTDASGRFMVDRFASVIVPSVTLLAPEMQPADRSVADSGRVLAIGAPAPTGFAPLEHAVDEVAAAVRFAPGAKILFGPDATEADVRAAIADPSASRVHVATHAVFARGSSRSALVLTDAGTENSDGTDGRLELQEILTRWRVPAELVVLGGCDTYGLGLRHLGDPLGFPNAFLAVGAKRVVSSRWPVDDEATALFMGRFYERLATPTEDGRPRTAARAMREAKVWLRDMERDGTRPFAHPIYWSGFALLGIPEEPPSRERSARTIDASSPSPGSIVASNSTASSVLPSTTSDR